MLKLRVPIPRFLTSGDLLVGKGSIGALRALGASRAALLVSPSMRENEALMERFKRCVGALETRIISLSRGEPSLQSLRGPLGEVCDFRPDWIIAAGGGSVLDAAKLIWIFYEHPDADFERLRRPFAVPDLRSKARLAALPTTAGTGSEVSSSAVLSDDTTGQKFPVVSHQLLPDLVILDPDLTLGVPDRAMAAAGLDALAHALESYTSRFQNPLADHFAETAAGILFERLPAAISNRSDAECVQEVQLAALMAGWVQNLKVPGVGHAIAHQLGKFGVGHGAACGALLAPALQANCSDTSVMTRYDRLGKRLGFEDHVGLIRSVQSLVRLLGLNSLAASATGGRPALQSAFDSIATGALSDICATANPVPVTRDLIEKVLFDAC